MTLENYVGVWEQAIPKNVSLTCGWCSRGVEMKRIGSTVELSSTEANPRFGQQFVVSAPFVCPRDECHWPTLVFFQVNRQIGYEAAAKTKAQVPRGRAEPIDGLPDEIAADRDEAWSCFHGGDHRAAVIMGRAAVQRAARSLKAEGDGLKRELNDLMERGVITRDLQGYADEVRIAGNEAAHPEEMGEVTPDEAQDSLEFMDEFLRHTIAMPARRRAREEARRAEGSAA